MRMMRAAMAIGLTGALALTACGSSSKSSTSSDESTTTTTAAAPSQDVTADKALADQANLKLNDFPKGWTSKPHDSSDDADTKAMDKQTADCLGVPVEQLTSEGPANADSPDFSDPNGNVTVSSSVNYMPDNTVAKERFALIDGPKTTQCLGDAVKALITKKIKQPKDPKDTLPPGAEIGTPSFDKLTSFPSHGDGTAAYRLQLPVKVQDQTITVVVDFIAVRFGRAGVTLTYQTTGTVVTKDEEEYLGDVLDRIKPS